MSTVLNSTLAFSFMTITNETLERLVKFGMHLILVYRKLVDTFYVIIKL